MGLGPLGPWKLLPVEGIHITILYTFQYIALTTRDGKHDFKNRIVMNIDQFKENGPISVSTLSFLLKPFL
jgi:hypothetical protein